LGFYHTYAGLHFNQVFNYASILYNFRPDGSVVVAPALDIGVTFKNWTSPNTYLVYENIFFFRKMNFFSFLNCTQIITANDTWKINLQ
jgi:hypothetical protein